MSHASLFNIVINNMAQATSLATPFVEHLSFCPHGRVSLCLQNPYRRPSSIKKSANASYTEPSAYL